MRQFITEFTVALMVCWLAFAALSGCAVDQQAVFNMITKTKSKAEQPHMNRLPASNLKTVKGKV
jgi:hypothetical protein